MAKAEDQFVPLWNATEKDWREVVDFKVFSGKKFYF